MSDHHVVVRLVKERFATRPTCFVVAQNIGMWGSAAVRAKPKICRKSIVLVNRRLVRAEKYSHTFGDCGEPRGSAIGAI